MTALRTRLEEVESRLSALAAARERGAASEVDEASLGQVAEQTRSLHEELDALEILGHDAAEGMSPVIEQGLAELETHLRGLERRSSSGSTDV